jgi:hypothetical protein
MSKCMVVILLTYHEKTHFERAVMDTEDTSLCAEICWRFSNV